MASNENALLEGWCKEEFIKSRVGHFRVRTEVFPDGGGTVGIVWLRRGEIKRLKAEGKVFEVRRRKKIQAAEDGKL